jgi:hypothetical protein
MEVLLGSLGVRAIPVAFAVMGAVEMVLLGAVLMVKVQRRVNAPLVVSAPTTV